MVPRYFLLSAGFVGYLILFESLSLDASEVQRLQASRFARPDVLAEDDVALKILDRLFDELKKRDRKFLELSWGEEHTIEEIAKVMGLTAIAAKVGLWRAKDRFLVKVELAKIEREALARWVVRRWYM
jgi:DNA-directed RNA polymerase specialized sigma24 family protein